MRSNRGKYQEQQVDLAEGLPVSVDWRRVLNSSIL
jgi:hypothetical protein